MQNTALIGLSRQTALARELDVVANNLANMETTGFKSDNSVFEEYLMPVARADNFPGAAKRLSYVQDRATWHNLSQGQLQQTGNPLDVALDGNGFLVVQAPQGERYTRNGALQLSATGQLVTSEGYPVLGDNGPIVLQPLDREVSISADGRISVLEGPTAGAESQRGKLRVVSFAQPDSLQKDESTLFAPGDDGAAPQAAPNVKIVQGSIEKSNVHGVASMTRMIEITRNYSEVAQMLQNLSDLKKNSIQQLADVPT
jgi:flagellar basal-body rod protein FlgF